MGVRHYFSHRIYADTKFRTLIDLLGEFLAEKHWVVDSHSADREYETLHQPPKIDITPGNRATKFLPRASILSAPARTIAEDSGMFLFYVINLRWGWEKDIINPFQVKVAQKEFGQCPNYIEIETHRKWYSGQKEIGEKIAAFIEARGIQTHIRSYEDEFIDIIDTAYDHYEEKVNALHDLTQSTIPWTEIPELAVYQLPIRFIPIIPQLHENTIRFLRTAEHLRNTVGLLPDNSPAIVEYCKTVEWELHSKVFQPITSKMTKLSTNEPYGDLKKLWRILGKQKELTLGEMKNFIVSAIDVNNDNNPIANAIRNSVFKTTAYSWLSDPFLTSLTDLIKYYRNAAAHKSVMTSKDVEHTRLTIIGDNDNGGLLQLICEL